MLPQAVQGQVRNIERFRGLLKDETRPDCRRLLEALLREEEGKLRAIPFRWGAPPTD